MSPCLIFYFLLSVYVCVSIRKVHIITTWQTTPVLLNGPQFYFSLTQFLTVNMYLFKLLNGFEQITKCIWTNCKIWLFKLSNVFVQIAKCICSSCTCICSNCKMYFNKFLMVFVKISKCICSTWQMYNCPYHHKLADTSNMLLNGFQFYFLGFWHFCFWPFFGVGIF